MKLTWFWNISLLTFYPPFPPGSLVRILHHRCPFCIGDLNSYLIEDPKIFSNDPLMFNDVQPLYSHFKYFWKSHCMVLTGKSHCMVLTGKSYTDIFVAPCEFQKNGKIISKYWKNTMHDNIICFDEDDTYHTLFDPSFKSTI